MLSAQIAELQRSPLVCHPGTHRVDSIAWIRLELLRLQAHALELAMGRRRSPGLAVRPIVAVRQHQINPRAYDSFVVFGD